MLRQIMILVALTSTSLYANAKSEKSPDKLIETCKIESSITLTEPTQIFCAKDLVVADGVEIITGGNGLQILTMGRAFFGSENGLGLNITAQAENAGPVSVISGTATGQLHIDNKATGYGADVEIEYNSSFGYAQTVDAGTAGAVRTVVNGQALPL